jgi:hypothetical protein
LSSGTRSRVLCLFKVTVRGEQRALPQWGVLASCPAEPNYGVQGVSPQVWYHYFDGLSIGPVSNV